MFIDTRMGGIPRYFLERPKDWGMRVPEDIRKCVVFLGRRIMYGGQERVRFSGTGFFVTVTSPKSGRRYLYLVTAKHVVNRLCLGDWLIRMNNKPAGVIDIRAPKDYPWWFHPTESDSVDVAVTPIQGPETADAGIIDESLFLDDAKIRESYIGAGDEVFMTGLFTHMTGRSRNLPIVRTGNVALIPDPGELVPGLRLGGRTVEAESYLIEARSIGGLSGSPVFVRTTIGFPLVAKHADSEQQRSMVGHLAGEFFLLGLVHGHWDIPPEEKNEPEPVVLMNEPEAVNMGIAIVVPAKKIREALYHPGLVEFREKLENHDAERLGTTPDLGGVAQPPTGA